MTVNTIIETYKKLFNLSSDKLKQLKNTHEIEIHDGHLFTDYELFRDELMKAKDKHIVIHPDYDADGETGGTIAKVSLDVLGFKQVDLYPPKPSNGYGLTPLAVDEILERWPTVKYILTVDNGINTKPAVDYAYEKGLKVIITDHHKPKAEQFPDKALVVINPNRIDKHETYPFKSISGAQTIWKLMQAIACDVAPDKKSLIDALHVFAGISIISDVMPIINENRRLLKDAIADMNTPLWFTSKALEAGYPPSYVKAMLGLHNLIERVKLETLKIDEPIDYDTIGFYISPMLNAPRRMVDDSKPAFDIFSTIGIENEEAIDTIVALNDTRKSEANLAKINFDNHAHLYADKHGIIYYDEHLRPGLAGIVSSHITETMKVPSVVLTKGYHGSGRSLANHNLHETLQRIEAEDNSIFTKWGGHEQAAGVGINGDKLNQFEKLFEKHALEVAKTYQKYDHLISDKAIELDVNNLPSMAEVKHALAEFESLKPYSQEVPAPKFKVEFSQFDYIDYRILKDKHIKFNFGNFAVIVWGQAEKVKNLDFNRPIMFEVMGQLDINKFNGRSTLQVTSQFLVANYLDEERN